MAKKILKHEKNVIGSAKILKYSQESIKKLRKQ